MKLVATVPAAAAAASPAPVPTAYDAATAPSRVLQPDSAAARLGRRQLLAFAALPLLAPPRIALAASKSPSVKLLEQPDVCQARCQIQDFVVIRYTGSFADGRPFDKRYAEQPLVYELGSFYLPGVDEALVGRCVGSKLQLEWDSSPQLRPEDQSLLPMGSAISMDIELVTIRYSLFGEKMRDVRNSFFFSSTPLSLTSPVDPRGHASSGEPKINRENPFAVGPTDSSFITNPSGLLGPLLGLPSN